jgi:hypothetical protein
MNECLSVESVLGVGNPYLSGLRVELNRVAAINENPESTEWIKTK